MRIKWVNDLFLNGRKLCGILTEGGASLESGLLEQVVIGIGINIRHTKTAFPPELCRRVTSIEEAVPDCHVKRRSCSAPCCANWNSCCRISASAVSCGNTAPAPA